MNASAPTSYGKGACWRLRSGYPSPSGSSTTFAASVVGSRSKRTPVPPYMVKRARSNATTGARCSSGCSSGSRTAQRLRAWTRVLFGPTKPRRLGRKWRGEDLAIHQTLGNERGDGSNRHTYSCCKATETILTRGGRIALTEIKESERISIEFKAWTVSGARGWVEKGA